MRGRSLHELSRDYLDVLARADEAGLEPQLRGQLEGYKRFIDRTAHRLGPCQGALREVALAEPQDSPVRQDVLAGLPKWKPGRPWFRRLHVPPSDPNPALLRTIDVESGVNAVALFERDRCTFALSGSENGT